MKLSQFKTILKNNLPKWNIQIDNNHAEFEITDWCIQNKIYFSDLNFIKESFEVTDLTVINKIAKTDDFIITSIEVIHNLQFEKE